jgi:hypothetical protein
LGKKRIKGILNMTHVSNRLGAILFGVAVAIPAFAEIPVDLRGDWVIDADATTAAMKKSSEWNDELEKMWPMQLSSMSRMSMTITSDSLVSKRGGRSDTVTADLVSTKKTGHILKITDKKDKVTRVAFQLLPKDRLRMLTGRKSDKDSPIWKKGESAKLDPDADRKLLSEVIATESGVHVQSVAKKASYSAGVSEELTNEISKVVLGMYRAAALGNYQEAKQCMSKSFVKGRYYGRTDSEFWKRYLFVGERGELDTEKTYVWKVVVDPTDPSKATAVTKRVYKKGVRVNMAHRLIKADGKWLVDK